MLGRLQEDEAGKLPEVPPRLVHQGLEALRRQVGEPFPDEAAGLLPARGGEGLVGEGGGRLGEGGEVGDFQAPQEGLKPGGEAPLPPVRPPQGEALQGPLGLGPEEEGAACPVQGLG